MFKGQTPLCLSLQKKYKEEAEKTMSHYVPVLDTPEMQRVRENQKNFSTVSRTCKRCLALLLPDGLSLSVVATEECAWSLAVCLFVWSKVLCLILYTLVSGMSFDLCPLLWHLLEVKPWAEVMSNLYLLWFYESCHLFTFFIFLLGEAF